MKPRVGVLVLAAGGSSRFGSPKLLEKIAGTTLVRHAASEALAASFSRVCVMVGGASEAVANEVADLPVSIVRNENWQDGMGTSVAAGVNALLLHNPDAVIVTLADQPLVTSTDLLRLYRIWQRSGADVVAAAYDDTTGVPALFARPVFRQLLALKGDQGARSVIRDATSVERVEMPHAAADVDTREDLAALRIR